MKQRSLVLSELSLTGLPEARQILSIFDLLGWSLLVFGTKGYCVGEPSMAGVSCLFGSAYHHRESGSDLANWLRKREVPARVVFISDHTESWVEDWKPLQWGSFVAEGH